MIPVCEPVLDGNEERYVLDCLKTNWISSGGQYVSAFERRFSVYCEAMHGVACSSGTAAIHLALTALGIGEGDEVIIPNFTLNVSANMVILAGAKPVLVDADRATWCIDPAQIEKKITARTKAIMPVHMYGHPCDMDRILSIARTHRLYVVEDAAEAHGAEYKGRRVGAIGDAGCFSFYGNKIITTGEGGMVVTNRADLAERLRLLRNQAFEEPRFVHRFVGYNYRMTNIQAAIGLGQCERIEVKVQRKREIGQLYTALLKGQTGVEVREEAPWAKGVYWMYGVLIGSGFGRSAQEVRRLLKDKGVETRPFFFPMSAQPVFRAGSDRRFPDTSGDYPISQDLYHRGLYLPSGLSLTEAQIREVAEKLLACRV